ncbi:MAG: phosphoenolpyruvate--protein phosphotransferase [Kiritimatiellae bacterium]|nr:phosphoenolpyruvate--protein phosphotransferase [Kiritimatiellia bacterium]
MQTVSGLAAARGYVSGPVFIYRGDEEIPIPEFVVERGRELDELMRLKRAMAETRRDLEGLIAVLKERTGRADVRVFECHLMILEDTVLARETEGYVTRDRLNAEAAVRKTMNGARAQFERMNDPYFRERVRDIDDVERRLLKQLTGYDRNPHLDLKSPAIVVADDLTPSETVQLPREYVLGFATNGGSTTSHVALLARALGIPSVCGLGNITSLVSPGETILLDGTNGAVTVNPDDATRAEFEALIRRQREFTEAATSGAPAGTLRDGGVVRIFANIHPGVPFASVKELGACGVGLYRSEYLWLNGETEPTEEEQFQAYRKAVELTAQLNPNASITIRMLDIGGDKTVRGISTKEANPFLGNRSIRYLLSHRPVMRTQMRAILRASAFGRTYLMYPMISCVEELREASIVLEDVKHELDVAGIAYDRDIPVGAMVEVPSAALNADQIARYVKFFSIGTNDLVQYTMAADRGNDAVAYLYQPLNPAIVKLVKMTVAAAKREGIPVAVCGESASDTIVGVYWAALGVDMLSMSATYIPAMARIFSRLTRADLDAYAKVPDSLPPGATAADVFTACHDWMLARIPDLEDALG